jgi:hypothetical protein
MYRVRNWFGAAVLACLFPPPVLPCQCAPPLPGTPASNAAICNSLPDLAKAGTAVFVGVVTEVYPKSPEHVLELCEKALGRRITEADSLSLSDQKRLVVTLWPDTLSPSEIQSVALAPTEDALETLLDQAMGWAFARRVRLRVQETFAGDLSDRVELFTGMGGGDCGIPFEIGRTYLVFAHQDRQQGRWLSGICSGTSELRYAEQDARTLRALKKGIAISPRIYGVVLRLPERQDDESEPAWQAEVHLRGPRVDRSELTDAYGRFVFDNLSADTYTIDVRSPGWRLSETETDTKVNLASGGQCVDLRLHLERADH